MYEPQIFLTGHIGNEPTLRFTPNGNPVTDLRVAAQKRIQVGDEWTDGETMWFDVACWRSLAEHAATSLSKGDKVLVSGKLSQRTWTRDDGTTGYSLMVDAAVVGPDLSRFPVTVQRPARAGAGAALAEEHDAWAAARSGADESAAPDEIAA